MVLAGGGGEAAPCQQLGTDNNVTDRKPHDAYVGILAGAVVATVMVVITSGKSGRGIST
jgi:hypothetical protein